jgi:hypothetical protein
MLIALKELKFAKTINVLLKNGIGTIQIKNHLNQKIQDLIIAPQKEKVLTTLIPKIETTQIPRIKTTQIPKIKTTLIPKIEITQFQIKNIH